jgi:pilus assembly protein TadC
MKLDMKKLKLDNNMLMLIVASIVMIAMTEFINFRFLADDKIVFSTVHLIAGMLAAVPLIYYKYRDYSKTKELESMFPVFLRDFIETARGGLTIPESFRTVSKNDYKSLSKHIKKVSAQLDWGIPMDVVLVNFSHFLLGAGKPQVRRQPD